MQKELVLENDIEQLAVLEQFLEEVKKEFRLEDTVVQNLNLVLEEAVSNIIFYAYPGETGRLIVLSLSKEMGRLEIVIRDAGLPFDPTSQENPDVKLAAEEREIGGLGIFLIRQIMDEVRYRRVNEENVLWMKMKLPHNSECCLFED